MRNVDRIRFMTPHRIWIIAENRKQTIWKLPIRCFFSQTSASSLSFFRYSHFDLVILTLCGNRFLFLLRLNEMRCWFQCFNLPRNCSYILIKSKNLQTMNNQLEKQRRKIAERVDAIWTAATFLFILEFQTAERKQAKYTMCPWHFAVIINDHHQHHRTQLMQNMKWVLQMKVRGTDLRSNFQSLC